MPATPLFLCLLEHSVITDIASSLLHPPQLHAIMEAQTLALYLPERWKTFFFFSLTSHPTSPSCLNIMLREMTRSVSRCQTSKIIYPSSSCTACVCRVVGGLEQVLPQTLCKGGGTPWTGRRSITHSH